MSKKIVILCDGTWNYSSSNTNVFKLSEIIIRSDNQLVRYFDGVGIENSTPNNIIVNGAVANDIDNKIKEVYRYIVENYVDGDKIWLFGFSRGAYTVRCVAGIIRNCGIVENIGLIDQAYSIYRNRDPYYSPDGVCSEKFKRLYNKQFDSVPIEFLGLWDTVGAQGIPNYTSQGFEYLQLYDHVVSNVVKHVRQALAIHERISFFEPCHAYQNSTQTVDIIETWFPGRHWEIGGGEFYGFSGNINISNSTLLWMIEHIMELPQEERINMNIDNIHQYREHQELNYKNILSLFLDKFLIFWLPKFNEIIPNNLFRDREIMIDSINKTLENNILYNNGNWNQMVGNRERLRREYISQTYEKLRRVMDSINIILPNNVNY